MRRLVLSVALVVAAMSMGGCSWLFGSVNRDFAEASKKNADVIFPEYEAYIDGDERLDSDTKELRKQTPKRWMKLIDDALAQEE
jgi:hypothetical protein